MDLYTPVETRRIFGGETTDERILHVLRRRGTHSLDQLSGVFPELEWAQVFLAVDRLSREGKVRIGPPQSGDYPVSAVTTDGPTCFAA